MSRIMKFNWALFWQRTIWTAVWIAAMGITFWLCRDLSKSQPALFALLILCAIGESVGLPYVRRSARQGNIVSAGFSFVITVLCMGVLLFSETSFWSSSIDGINQQAMRERTVRDGHDLVLKSRAERYASLVAGEAPEQLQANLDAKTLDPIFSRSASCTDATMPDSRAFCAEFFALKARIAEAREARQLEGKIWASATAEETSIRRNFYQGAVVTNEWLGKGVEFWVSLITVLFVLALQALRVGPLYIGWAPEKKARDEDAPKASQTPPGPAKATPAPSPRGGTKQPVLGPEWQEKRASLAPRLEKPAELPKPHVPYVKIDNTSKTKLGSIAEWQSTFLIENPKLRNDGEYWHQPTVESCWVHYAKWCEAGGMVKAVKNKSWFSRNLILPEDRRKGKYHGAAILGYQLREAPMVIRSEQKRKVA